MRTWGLCGSGMVLGLGVAMLLGVGGCSLKGSGSGPVQDSGDVGGGDALPGDWVGDALGGDAHGGDAHDVPTADAEVASDGKDDHSIVSPTDVSFIDPPVEGANLSAHPLIHNGRLYVYWTVGGTTMGPQYLAAYDIEDDYKVVWETKLVDQALYLAGGDSGIINLMVTDNRIPMVFLDNLANLRFVQVHSRSGAVVVDREVPDKWHYVDPKGKPRSKSVIEPLGAVSELGEHLFFSKGTAINKCSGDVYWSSYGAVMGALFKRDAVVVRRTAYGFENSGGLGVKAWNLAMARPVLTGFAQEEEAFLFETDPGNTQSAVFTTNDFLLADGLIWKGRSYPDGGEGIPAGSLFMEAYDVRNGEFVRRIPLQLPLNPAELVALQWNDVVIHGHITLVDGMLLVPFRAFTISDTRGFMVLAAVDVKKGQQAWAVSYEGQHSTLIPTAGAVYVLETHQDENFDYSGFDILKLDLATGSKISTVDGSGAHLEGRWTPLSFPRNDQSVLLLESQPLLHSGRLFLPLHGPTGSTVAVVSLGNDEYGPLQYKYNNQLNPVFNSLDPLSNQAADPVPTTPQTPEDSGSSDEELLGQEAGPDETVDPLPTEAMDQTVLDALGVTTADLGALPWSYTAVLSSVTYSNSGESDGNNLGEGYLRLRGKFGCTKTEMRYPWKGFVPLAYNPFGPSGAGTEFLTFEPLVPLAWRPVAEMEGSNAGLHISYSALEDDEMGLWDTVISYVGKALAIVEAWAVGDFCAIAEVVSGTIAAEANDYTEHFGAPFLEIFEGKENVPSTFFGVPQDARQMSYDISGSASRGILVTAKEAIGAACAITDVVQGDLSALDDAMGSTLDVFSPDDKSTKGVVTLRRALALPVERFSVTLDKVEVLGAAGSGDVEFDARIGLLSMDSLSSEPEGAVSVDETPFRSYVKRAGLTVENGAEEKLSLYDVQVSGSGTPPGSAGFYIELDLRSRMSVMEAVLEKSAFFSDTRFFEDLLYGSWEQDATKPERFTQTVRKRFYTPMMEGYVTLTFAVTLDM